MSDVKQQNKFKVHVGIDFGTDGTGLTFCLPPETDNETEHIAEPTPKLMKGELADKMFISSTDKLIKETMNDLIWTVNNMGIGGLQDSLLKFLNSNDGERNQSTYNRTRLKYLRRSKRNAKIPKVRNNISKNYRHGNMRQHRNRT
eukprot:484766_1